MVDTLSTPESFDVDTQLENIAGAILKHVFDGNKDLENKSESAIISPPLANGTLMQFALKKDRT